MQYTNQTRKTFIQCKKGTENFTAHITLEIVQEGFSRGLIVPYHDVKPVQKVVLTLSEADALLRASGISYMSDSLLPEHCVHPTRVIEPSAHGNAWVFWPQHLDFKIKPD